MYGKVVTVRHQAVTRKKDNRFAVALDSEQNNIHVKDIVKVIDGPHSVSITSCLLTTPEIAGVGMAMRVTVLSPLRAGRAKFAISSAALPFCTARNWWRTGGCLSARPATSSWQGAPR